MDAFSTKWRKTNTEQCSSTEMNDNVIFKWRFFTSAVQSALFSKTSMRQNIQKDLIFPRLYLYILVRQTKSEKSKKLLFPLQTSFLLSQATSFSIICNALLSISVLATPRPTRLKTQVTTVCQCMFAMVHCTRRFHVSTRKAWFSHCTWR